MGCNNLQKSLCGINVIHPVDKAAVIELAHDPLVDDILDFDLADGQTLVVDTGCMVMVEPTVNYEVKMQGGVAKSLFGGEGLFLVHMTGPGHVTLQTLPFSRTARRVLAAAGGGRDEAGGGILGGILGE